MTRSFELLHRALHRPVAACAVALALWSTAQGAALGDVFKTSDGFLVAQEQAQKRVDALSDERRDLEEQYRTTLRESDGLRLYIQQLAQQLKSQREEMEVVKQETQEIERTTVQIVPLMQNMLSTLDKFISLDMPFLLNERKQRVQQLNDMMARADVTVSEKYRRIVEAYQIEMEFGRTIEAYKGDLKDKEVNFLRVGRVALMYQTPDGKETGYWDASKKDWVEDNHYAEAVSDGLRIARKEASPDLLIVPVQAAKKEGA